MLGVVGDTLDADNVLEGILYFLRTGTTITADSRKINSALYHLKPEHPELMRDFYFDEKAELSCEQVDFVLSCMTGTGMVCPLSPGLDRYRVNETLPRHFEATLKSHYSPKQLKELEKIAREFKTEVLVH